MNKLKKFLDDNEININDSKIDKIINKKLEAITVDDLQYLSNLSGFNPEAVLSELLN